MTRMTWGRTGTKRYSTGVDRGALYLVDSNGNYSVAVPWHGLTNVTQSPSGAESNKQYADNGVYANLQSAEEFGATIEAFFSPKEFDECDGAKQIAPGVTAGQQGRRAFGFSYRTLLGNDTQGTELGYELHLIYGCQAAPSEKANATVNDSPELSALSWEITTTPVDVPIDGFKPTARITIDSTEVTPAQLSALEDRLYGTAGADGYLPLPEELADIFGGTNVAVETVAPTYNPTTDTVTIPTVTGVNYFVGNEPVTGAFTITEDTVVTARPAAGYRFTNTSDTDWTVNYS